MTVTEKLEKLARRSRLPSRSPHEGAHPQLRLDAGVAFSVPGVDQTVWLVPDATAAAQLGLRPGSWLTPEDLLLLDGLPRPWRTVALRRMQSLGCRLQQLPWRTQER